MPRSLLLAALLAAASLGIAQAAEKPTQPPASRPAKAAAAGKTKEPPPYTGPTETDIRVAYTDKINTINAGTRLYLDPKAAARLTIRLEKVNYVECDPVADRTDLYVCNVLIESAVGPAEVEFKRVELALIKDKDAWRVH